MHRSCTQVLQFVRLFIAEQNTLLALSHYTHIAIQRRTSFPQMIMLPGAQRVLQFTARETKMVALFQFHISLLQLIVALDMTQESVYFRLTHEQYRMSHSLSNPALKILQRNLNRSTFVVWEMKRNVSVMYVVRLTVATRSSGPPTSGKITKEMPGSVASGTPILLHPQHVTIPCEIRALQKQLRHIKTTSSF
jgi:hypothetical protein